MKAKWKDEEIKSLFKLIENQQLKNASMLECFKIYGKQTKRKPFSVRNFYYAQVKLLQQNENLCKKLGIDISKHKIQKFEHFDKKTEKNLKNSIEKLRNDGVSIRSACLALSGGDIKKMLRIQNKYRNILAQEKKETAKVYSFPKENSQKQKLSDDDIKSLFMGLVKLVKENADNDSQEKAKKFLEQTEQEKRKNAIELEEKSTEISNLKNEIRKLKIQNSELNQKLKDYRTEYIKNLSQPNNYNLMNNDNL